MMRALFTISLLELLLGGGGRITAIGPISLRMLLFVACMGATAVAVAFPRRRSGGLMLAVHLVIAYLIIDVLGLLTGSLHGETLKKIFAEFQQSLYWLAAPFFALMLQTRSDVEGSARIVRSAGILLALGYLGIVTALITGVISFSVVNAIVRDSREITMRSGEFFVYKGFLYLGVAILFLVALRPRYWIISTVIIATALVLTFTRGFLLSTSLALLLMLVAQRRWHAAIPALIVAAAGAAFIWIYLPSSDTSMEGKYEASTGQRIEDMMYIVYHMKPTTLLFGEGFGSLINNRLQIENTYLWALWKLGLPGLLFWLVPLVLCSIYYYRIPRRHAHPFANAFMFGTVLVYLQTAANPFLNNPIGLSFVLLALFSLRVLSRDPWGAARAERPVPAPLSPSEAGALAPAGVALLESNASRGFSSGLNDTAAPLPLHRGAP